MPSADVPSTRLATRLAFLVAGFGMSCWAPLVPYAKQRLGIDDAVLGILILCLGVGSVAAMLVTGVASARLGSKPIIVAASLGLCATLPLLAVCATPLALAAALLAFGAALGSLDVAMNMHSIEVERAAGRPLLSGFHALFSVGGFLGAGAMTLMLSLGVTPLAGTLIGAALMIVATLIAWPRLLPATRGQSVAPGRPKPLTAPSGGSERSERGGHEGPLLVMPHGVVLVLAALAAVTFLIEGALLDWGALLLTGSGLVDAARGGLGYMVFSIAMTAGRFGGDAITARFGDRAILHWGSFVALCGFVVLLTAPVAAVAMTGFALIGLGASNLVPVLFRRAGTQQAMPAGLAVAAVTTTGYAGILLGPAAIGFVADATSLSTAFWMLAGLMCLVPLSAGVVVATNTRH